ncbi:MAG: tetratricopeptide repeat protein [Deltaproteobacteria bacterium]|nr:tetratricopeptide repeat protein [Deltaproteobacteria bacterium]
MLAGRLALRPPLGAALLAAAVALAVYAPTVEHGFAFDDLPEVVDNDSVRSLAAVPRMFAQAAWAGSGEDNPIYRPLTTATYALNHAIGGLAPAGFHLGNVLLHALVAALVVLLASRLGLPLAGAGMAGLLFAVLPVHAEAVANVAGRKDLLAAAFLLGALLLHPRALRGSLAAAAGVVLLLGAAMFSKESGVVGIGLLAARDLVLGREDWRRAPRRSAGLFALYAAATALYLLARKAAVGTVGVPLDHIPWAENPIAHADVATRVRTAVAVLARGLSLQVAPLHLSPDYSYAAIPPSPGWLDGWFLAGLALAAALVAGAVAGLRRWPLGALCLLWYAGAIFPASNLLVPIGTILGERLLYLPSLALCLVLGAGAAVLWARFPRPALRWGAALLLLALGGRAWAASRIWADELTLFTAGVEAQPRSSKMRQCLGAVLMERGRPAEALPHFQAAVEILRGTPAPLSRHLLEVGVALEALGRRDEAAATYQEILASDPGYGDARWRLGVVRWSQARKAEAVEEWQRTVAADPSHARALSDLGIAAMAAGDEAGARRHWERAAAADPRLASAWYRLAGLYERAGERDRARAAWREFLAREHGKQPRERAVAEERLRALGSGP